MKKALFLATTLLSACAEPQPTPDSFKQVVVAANELEHVKGELQERARRALKRWSAAESICSQSGNEGSEGAVNEAVHELNKRTKNLIEEAHKSMIHPDVKNRERYALQLEVAKQLIRYNGWQASCDNTRLVWNISYGNN